MDKAAAIQYAADTVYCWSDAFISPHTAETLYFRLSTDVNHGFIINSKHLLPHSSENEYISYPGYLMCVDFLLW